MDLENCVSQLFNLIYVEHIRDILTSMSKSPYERISF